MIDPDLEKRDILESEIPRDEVFTPSWICNNMNNLIDAAWFERKTSPFTVEGHEFVWHYLHRDRVGVEKGGGHG